MRAFSYRPRQGETYAANCRPVTGGSAPSFHAFMDDTTWTTWTGVVVQTALATDFNSSTNPYGSHLVTDMPRAMVDAICAIRTRNGVLAAAWGGYFKAHKDAMHYEVRCFPADLATGIDPTSVYQPAPPPEPDLEVLLMSEFFIIFYGDAPGPGDNTPARWAWWPGLGSPEGNGRKTFISGEAAPLFLRAKGYQGEILLQESEVKAIPYLDPAKNPAS